MRPVPDWNSRSLPAEEAVRGISSGMNVFVHGSAATPTTLLEALAKRTDVENVTLYHLHLEGPVPWTTPEHVGRFRSVSLFTGANMREPVNAGRADFVPIFLSDVPSLFLSGRVRLDAALVQLSPPDRHGYCSLGTSVDAARAAVDSAPMIIAEINNQMPRTHGDTSVPFEEIEAFTHTDRPLPQHLPEAESPVIARIGELVAGLVEDGSTLQMGIGAIPDAVLSRLHDRHDLGVHTEMFSDRLVDLVEAGAVNNRLKAVHPGRIVTSFVLGSKRVFDFVTTTPRSSSSAATHQRHRAHRPQSEGRRDQLAPSRSTSPARSAPTRWAPHLLGHRRADGLHPRRGPQRRRQADHRAAEHGRRRQALAHRGHAQARRRRGDHARPRALGRDRVRRGEPPRQEPAGARRTAHEHRASRLPRRADQGRPPGALTPGPVPAAPRRRFRALDRDSRSSYCMVTPTQ
jgi:hypothetical protein